MKLGPVLGQWRSLAVETAIDAGRAWPALIHPLGRHQDGDIRWKLLKTPHASGWLEETSVPLYRTPSSVGAAPSSQAGDSRG